MDESDFVPLRRRSYRTSYRQPNNIAAAIMLTALKLSGETVCLRRNVTLGPASSEVRDPVSNGLAAGTCMADSLLGQD